MKSGGGCFENEVWLIPVRVQKLSVPKAKNRDLEMPVSCLMLFKRYISKSASYYIPNALKNYFFGINLQIFASLITNWLIQGTIF